MRKLTKIGLLKSQHVDSVQQALQKYSLHLNIFHNAALSANIELESLNAWQGNGAESTEGEGGGGGGRGGGGNG